MELKTIKENLEDLQKDPLPFATVSLDKDNYFEWNVTLLGPQNTPYEGGIFKLKITLSKVFPSKPPILIFARKIIHPNISRYGHLCWDCIEAWPGWQSERRMRNLLEDLFNMLIYPSKKCTTCDHLGIHGTDVKEYVELTKKWIAANFKVGDEIKLLESSVVLEDSNQQWGYPLLKLKNKIGKIIEVTNHGYTVVDFDGEIWDLNSLYLVHATDTSIESNISITNNDIKPDISNATIPLSPQTTRNITEDALLRYYNTLLYYAIYVVFKVRNGAIYESFPCHRLVISMSSPVLADELSILNENDEIEITDISPAAFEVLVKYCYGLKEDLKKNCKNINFLLNILKAAKKYQIKLLEDYSYAMFSSVLPTTKNVFDMLETCLLINCEHLKLRCFKILQTQTSEIISSLDLSSVTDTILNTLLDMPVLSLNSEYELLSWIFEWGSYTFKKYNEQGNQASLKDILKPYLRRLNFLSLTPEEFVLILKKYEDFFDDKEGLAIIMNIVCRGSRDLPIWCNDIAKSRTFKCENSSN